MINYLLHKRQFFKHSDVILSSLLWCLPYTTQEQRCLSRFLFFFPTLFSLLGFSDWKYSRALLCLSQMLIYSIMSILIFCITKMINLTFIVPWSVTQKCLLHFQCRTLFENCGQLSFWNKII